MTAQLQGGRMVAVIFCHLAIFPSLPLSSPSSFSNPHPHPSIQLPLDLILKERAWSKPIYPQLYRLTKNGLVICMIPRGSRALKLLHQLFVVKLHLCFNV